MLKNLLLGVILFTVWTSPDLRSLVANGLRETAKWIEPTNMPRRNPKHFQIPNPFYKDEKKNDNNRFK